MRAVATGAPPLRSVVGGSPPLLLHPPPYGRAPATVAGGKGDRCLGDKPPGFFVGWRLGAFTAAWSSFLLPRPLGGRSSLWSCVALLLSGDTLPSLNRHPSRPLRAPFGRPQPPFSPKARARLAQCGRGPFKLTGLARQPRNNLKLSPRPHRPKHEMIVCGRGRRPRIPLPAEPARGRGVFHGIGWAGAPIAGGVPRTRFWPSGFALGA